MLSYRFFSSFGCQSFRLVALALLMLAMHPLEAAVVQWTGGAGGGDTNWTTAANWSSAPALPGVGDTVEFATGGASVYVDSSQTVAGITLNSAANLTIGGPGTLTIGSATGLTITGTSNFSITCPVALSVSQPWTHNGTGSFVVSGAVAVTGGQTWTIGGTGSMTISGVVSGALSVLTKNGSGTLTLSGTNTYTGASNVAAGVVVVNNIQAFGTTAGGVVLTSGAAIQVNGFTVGAEALNVSGTGIGGAGALIGAGGTWGGAVTMAADTTIGGSGSLNITGVVSGAFALTKIGTGTLTLSGNNTYTGVTNVNVGTLAVNNAGALGTNAGNTIVASGAAIQVNAFTVASEALTVNGGTAVVANGGTWNGTVTMNADTTFGGNANLTVGGVISGTAALTKTGTGVLTLGAVNTYTGATTITTGTLRVTGSLDAASTVAVGSGTTLEGTGSVGTVNVAGTGSISPGTGGNNIGTLTTAAVNYLASTNVLRVDLNGTVPTNDLLTSTGTIALAGNTLTVGSVTNAINGRVYTIVSGSSVTGTFNGLPDGTLLMTNGRGLRINYLPAPGAATSVTLTDIASVWTGGGTNNLWTNAANWGGTAPTAGDPLIFAGVTRLAPWNDFAAGTAFTSVTFLAGSGDFVLGGNAFTLTGGTTAITSNATTGTMTIGNALTFSTAAPTITSTAGGALVLSGTVDNGGLLTTVAAAGPVTISGAISGAGGVTKTGASTLTLSGANTFSGTVTISTGTLQVANGSAIPDTVPVVHTTGATFALADSTETIGSLAGSGGTVALGTGTLITGANDTSTTFPGVISGAGNVTKVGSGTWTVSGNNTYTGLTTISVGVFLINNGNALGSVAGGTTVETGAALQLAAVNVGAEPLTLNGTGIANSGALVNTANTGSWAGDVTLASDSSLGGTAAAFITGVISGNFALNKVNTGTWRLDGANTYTGLTTVSAGVLALGNSNALGDAGAGTIVASGATLRLDTVAVVGESVTISGTGAGGNGALRGQDNLTGSWGGPVILAGNSTIFGTGNTHTISGVISGGFALTKAGSGTWIFSGANTYTGLTTVSGGRLTVQHATALGTAAAGTSVSSGATLDLDAVTVAGETLSLNGTGVGAAGALFASGVGGEWTGPVNLIGGSSIGGTGTATISGSIGGPSALTKVGVGTWTLTAANGYSGTTTISAGTLVAANAQALGSTAAGTTVAADATLQIGGFAVVGETLILNGIGAGGTGALIASGTGSWTGTVALASDAMVGVAGTTTFSGVVSGAFTLTKDGAGEVRLTAANTFGGLTIASGRVWLAGGVALSDAAVVTLADVAGVTLDLAGSSETIGALGGGGATGGVVTLGAGTLTTGTSGSPTFGGVISGTGGFNITGSGTMTLTGTSTYGGATTITGATVVLSGDAAAIPASVSLTLGGGASLSMPGIGSTDPDRILDSATVTMHGATITLAAAPGVDREEVIGGLIFGSGANVITLVPDGANTAILRASGYGHSAGATLTYNPTDSSLTRLFFTSATDGEVLGWATVTHPTTGTGQHTTANGLVVATSSKVTAQVGDWATPATWSPIGVPLPSDNVQVLHAVTLTTDQTVLSLAIGPGGDIAQVSGRRTLTVTSGAVQVSGVSSPTIDANLAAGSADVQLQHDGTGTLTVLGAISGANLSVSAGTATVRLGGANTYSGTTTVLSGTLVAAHSAALSTTIAGTQVIDGAALVIDGVAIGSEALTIRGNGPGGIGALSGSGTASLTGTITLQAATGIGSSGTLTLSGAISGAFALTKVGSGTVVLSGANTYSGGTTVSAGTLQAVRTSLPGAVVNNATLAISEATSGTFTAGVTGPGDFVKLGAGTLILVPPTLITGTTTVSQGTLQLNNLNGTVTDERVTGPVINNATLAFNYVRPALPTAQAASLFSSVISGSGAVTKLGDGLLELDGLNTFTGTTTISGGILRVSNEVVANADGALGNSNATITIAGGVLEVNTPNVTRPLAIGAAGGRIDAYGSARTVAAPIAVSALGTGGGLTSSIVAASLRAVLLDDWRTTQTITGTRIDPLVNFTGNAFGTAAERAAYGITLSGSTDTDWHTFSMQWDGYLRVPNANTHIWLFTDDTARLWIDFNDNGLTDSGEWSGFSTANTQFRATATPLAAGTYRIRLQFEEGTGSNLARLLWSDAANSAGTVTPNYVIPASFLSGFAIGGVNTVGTTGQDLTLSGVISGTGSMSKVGTSTALLTAGNTYAGGTYVVGGTLRSGAAEVLPDQALAVDALATFDLDGFTETVGALSGNGDVTLGNATLTLGSGDGNGTFTGVVSGVGGVTKLGTGTQVFSGANTYLGTTQVSAGVLAATNAAALGDVAGATVVDSGGSLEVRAITIPSEQLTLNGLGHAGSGALRATGTAVVGGTIDLASATSVTTTGDLTLSGVVSGAGGWSLNGGTISVSAANTFTGTTTVASGTLVIGNDLALGTTAGGTVVASGATLALTGATIVGEGLSLSGTGVGGVGALSNDTNGSGEWTGDIVLAANATIGGTGTSTALSGIISGSGGLTKAGSGAYVLSGANTFTGATTVAAGTLTLAGDNGSIAASSAVAIGNGATLTIDPNGAANPDRIGDAVDVTFTGGSFVVQAPATVAFAETIGRLVVTSGANLVDLHPTVALTTQLTATSGFSQTSPATFTLDRNVAEGTANLFLGGVADGTVYTWSTVIETGSAIGRYSTVDGLVGISGGFYTIADGLWTAPATWFGGNVPGVGDAVDVRHVVDLTSDQGVVSLGLSDNGAITTGGGARRTLTIGAGTVTIAASATAPLIDANLAFAAVDAVIRQDAAVTATIVGVISGTGSVTKTGAGTLRLEGANTYSGATQIAAGTVVLAHANALGTTAAGTTVASGASIDLDGITLAAEPLTLSGTGAGGLGVLTSANTASTTGTITLPADASIGGGGTLTLAGVVAGSGRLTKVGSGTVVLSAINTYSGGTTVSAGTLRGASDAFPGNIINQATLEFAQSATGTYASIISGNGAVRKTGAGTLILSGANTYTGTTTVLAGIVRVTADVIAGVAGPLGAANTAVDLAGGSFESATTTVSRPLQVSAAGVRIDVSGTARTIASPIYANGTQVLTVGNSNGLTATFSGALSDGVGTLALVKDGSNTVVLTGTNTYSGGTTVSAGILQGPVGGLQGNIANNASLIFDQTGVGTFSGLISGTGSLTKIGAGTVVMGAANTYTGATSIEAGIMRASADVIDDTPGPFGSSAVAVVLNGGGIESDTDVFSRAITVAGAGGQLDAYALDRTVSAPITLNNGGPGLTASIISSSMRTVSQDDWRATQTVISTRVDPRIYFRSNNSNNANTFGTATEWSTYAISNAITTWEDFSIQWDGWVSVLVANTILYTISDDYSRVWIDANNNSVIDSGEWGNNGWGATGGQGPTARAVSGPLPVGLYRIRIQYEQGTGGGEMSLLWNDATNSDGIYNLGGTNYHIIPNARFAPFTVGGATVVGATGQTLTLTGVINGTNAGLQKVGSSTVVLGAVNTYGGPTLVTAGTLRAGIEDALPPTHLAIPTGGTLDLADFDQTVGPLSSGSTGGGALLLGAADLTVTSSTPSLFEGVISGTGGLTKLGAAKLTLSGTNTFTGLVTVTAGTLGVRSSSALGGGASDVTVADGSGVELVGATIAGRTLVVTGAGVGGTGAVQASGTSTWSGPVTLSGPTTVTVANGGTLTWSGVLSGTDTVTSNGAGTLMLSGTNTWTGDLAILAGTVTASGGAAISDLATVTLADVAGAAFSLGSSETIGALAGGGNLGGNVALGTSTLTLGGNNSSTIFAGTMSGTGGLVKVGTGNFTIAGASTVSGATTLSAGELTINSTTISSVTAANGTTLSGSGSLGVGTLATATLRPGSAGAATLTMTALNLVAGSILDFGLGTTSDRVIVSGAGTFDGTLNVTALTGFGPGIYPLITVAGAATDQGITLGDMPGGFTYQLDVTTTPGTVLLVVGAQTVQVAASDAAAAEAGLDPGEFTITRIGTDGDLVVYYTLGGTATSGADYVAPSGSVTILDGATTATVTITPIDDQATIGFASASQTLSSGATTVTISVVLSGVESDPETIILTLTADPTYVLGTTTSATVNLADDDQAAGSLDVSVDFAITGLYPDLGDRVETASPLVITAGDSSADIVITLAATPWSTRTFNATLSGPTNATLGLAAHTVTLPANEEEKSSSTMNNCGLGSGLTAFLLLSAFLLLRWRRD